MLSFGIDTSNYATSLAVVDTTRQEVVCAKKRFLPVKQGELGLRQSDAVFHHTQALPQLLDEMRHEVDFSRIGRVGASARPRGIDGSYMPCFLAGVSFGSAFAAGAGVQLVQTSHQQGHIQAALFGTGKPELEQVPVLLFHISGGTTDLLLAEPQGRITELGTSRDLYAGQAIDRLGVSLGFSFPAGEHISSLAETCSETIRSKISVDGMNCHLSGLENQCARLLADGKSPEYVAKYCLIVIADTVVAMLKNAREIYPGLPVVCAGGVMCSSVIRPQIANAVENIYFAPPELSSDNAVGVALIAAKEDLLG